MKQYYVKRGEATSGPFRAKKLKKAARLGKLLRDDLLGYTLEGPWRKAETISVLPFPDNAGKHGCTVRLRPRGGAGVDACARCPGARSAQLVLRVYETRARGRPRYRAVHEGMRVGGVRGVRLCDVGRFPCREAA